MALCILFLDYSFSKNHAIESRHLSRHHIVGTNLFRHQEMVKVWTLSTKLPVMAVRLVCVDGTRVVVVDVVAVSLSPWSNSDAFLLQKWQ